MNRVVVITPPATFPVTLAEAKAHLRYTATDQDGLIMGLVEAATDYAEAFTGRAFIDRTLDFYLDKFPVGAIELPLPPLIEVSGLFYVDDDGNEQQFTTFEVDTASHPGRIYLNSSTSWPTPRDAANAVRIRYRAGYLDSASPPSPAVPASIMAAILLTIGTLFEHRETVVVGQPAAMVPWSAEQLLRRYRFELSAA